MNGSLTNVLARLSPSQLSCLPTYRKVQRGGCNTCLYLVFPIESGKRKKVWCLHIAGFASVVFFYLSQGKAWVI